MADKNTVSVKFLESREVDGVKFEEGKTYPLNPQSAYRWVRRKVAQYTDKNLQAEFDATDSYVPPK